MEKAIESVKVAMNSTDKTTSHIRGTTPEIQAAARRLRRNMTPAEKKLWQALKGKQLDGLKFRASIRSVHSFWTFIALPANWLSS